MTNSISLARTPFQLFNCIEAVKKFNNNGKNILICIYKKKSDLELYNEITKEYPWEKVHFLELNFFNKLFYSFTLNQIIKKYKNYEYCFFGLITSYNIHAINKIHATYNVLIDDGNEIFLILDNILSCAYNKKFKTNFFNILLNKKFNLDFLNKLKIFTFFNIDKSIVKNEIIENNYSEFRKSVGNLLDSDEVFFIGSNLIDTYISKELFEKMLENTLKYYKGKDVIYIPHRYENIEYLNELSKQYNFKIKKFSTILELAILNHGKKPKELISIRSTALETLSFLYNIESKRILKLDLNQLLKEHQKKEFLDLYENYKTKNIDIIEVEND